MHLLGIDLGTSALKAILVDERQAVVAAAEVRLAATQPRAGWSEQEPGAWWAALCSALEELRATSPAAMRGVGALGLAGQMHGAVLLDGGGEPLRPAILWNDGRAGAESAALLQAVPDLPQVAGVRAMPGLTAPKLLWVRRHEPHVFAKIAKVVSPKDFLRLRLTGEIATDVSDAAGTLWLDQARRDWSDAILAATGLDRSRMPALVEGTAITGALDAANLRRFGMDGPVTVAGGAGDASAAGIGIGAVEDGDSFISLGTSAQYFVTDDRYRPQPETLLHAFAHALPGRWFRMAAMLNGASCLAFAARLLGEADIEVLLSETEAVFRGPSRVLFLPYLTGERTPHDDANARGVYFGFDPSTSAADLVQATLEGVAFSLLEAQRLLDSSGVRVESVAAVGGGARSRFWMQIVAHVLGRPVVRYAGSDKGPAFGAARLARMALTGEAPSEVCGKPAVTDVLLPDPALTEEYALRFERYQSLYRALKPEFAAAAHAPAQTEGHWTGGAN